ncbi:MAG: hypothetical protein D6765_12225 [Bacteroidetes bacterium]|nr:MAG: hypothetical protein D6765_12225 [Bacteroidota bacterium]
MTFTKEQIAEKLLLPLWRGLDEQYKSRYVRNIWEQFENNLLAASYTSTLSEFVQNLTGMMPIQVQAKDMKDLLAVTESGQDYDVLELLREHTTTLVMITRLMNQDRKLSYQKGLFDEDV